MEDDNSSLYPDLKSLDFGASDDILTALSEPKRSRPPARPPPPRSQAIPARAIDNILNDEGTDIPGVETTPTFIGRGNTPPFTGSTNEAVSVPAALEPDKVRWFYQEPGKFWQPFSGVDSLALESCHSRLMGGVLPTPGNVEAGLVQVMGDLYEVNIFERTCRHIYWSDINNWPVLRGVWYEVISDRWYPVPETEWQVIEDTHTNPHWRGRVQEESFAGSKVTSASQTDSPSKPQKQTGEVVLHKISLDKYDVLWISGGSVKKMKTGISSKMWNIVGSKFSKDSTYGATQLIRGYKEKASHDEALAPIGHVVFVVHGIGQSMDMSCINKSTTDFRTTCAAVAKKQFSEQWSSKRVEFIPVEWRTWLSLDKGVLSMITPHGVKKLRSMFNDSVLDVLYYVSPKFGPEIRDGLRFSLQKQYNEFMQRHPSFLSEGGTVSIIGHSLGSVISYDLLLDTCHNRGLHPTAASGTAASSTTGKPSEVELGEGGVLFRTDLSSPPPADQPDLSASTEGLDARLELQALRARVSELEIQLGERKAPQGLSFFVDHFFAVGSPLAMFLMMREHEQLINRTLRSAESLIPSCVCARIHNVHHPSDPVAYRLEPLINPLYAGIKPVRIDTSSKISKEALDHAEGQRTKPPLQTHHGKSWFSALSLFSSSSPPPKKTSPEPTRAKSADKVADNDKHLSADEKLRERLDFMLKESIAESSYINSLTAHTGYWTSNDCAQYVLLQLFSYKSPGPH